MALTLILGLALSKPAQLLKYGSNNIWSEFSTNSSAEANLGASWNALHVSTWPVRIDLGFDKELYKLQSNTGECEPTMHSVHWYVKLSFSHC
jgi:hypothetical protein